MAGTIREWLDSLELGQHADAFEDNDLDLTLVVDLSDADLRDLGVTSMGHRKRLLRAIEALAPATAPLENQSAPGVDRIEAEQEPVTTVQQAERRQLTVMFSDLVGSTALSQQLDPEDLHDLMRRYQDAVGAVVARYGGFVAKFLGDGALAYFGWPQAYEDQTERALRAGLETVAAVQQISIQGGGTLQARAGIATGQVVIGDIVGEIAKEADAVVGDTPNLAARLQEVAEPGQLVIEPVTRRLVGATFEFGDLGHQTLKGFTRPISVWCVLRERTFESRFEASHSASLTQFVGRQSEIGLMLDRWSQAVDGDGQVLMLSGEAGIGKSRLVQAFEQRVGEHLYTRLRYQCSPFHTNSALYPVIRQLERAAGFSAGDTADERLNKLEQLIVVSNSRDAAPAALLAALLSVPYEERYGTSELAPLQRKSRTLQLLTEQLVVLARNQPVLCVFEDAHWIDPSTYELLEQTIPLIVEAPILLVVTHRPEWRAPWTEKFGNVASLSLSRLGRSFVIEIVRTIAGEAAADALVGEIAARTDGIPLFVEEMTKAALEAAGFSEHGRLQVPETLQTSLLARLDRLGDAKELAQIGAVIGREFDYGLLASITAMSEAGLEASLSHLVQSELVFQRGAPPDALYTFKHALVQDTAYSSLLRSKRRQLHGRIAEALTTEIHDATAVEPEVLAHHYTEAEMIEPAIDNWSRGGHRAAERSANVEAISHFGKALTLLDRLPDDLERSRRELALRAGLGVPLSATKGPGASENFDNYERARQLCSEIGDTSELYQVLWGCWRANLVIAKLDEARDLADQLLRLAESKQDQRLLLEAHHAQWTTLSRVHEPLECWKQAERGIALYEADKHHRHVYTITDHDAGVCCRCFGGLSLWQLGYPDRALALARDALALAQQLSHPTSMAHALSHSAWLHQLRRDYDTVVERAAEIDVFATERGFPQYVATGSILKGWSLTRMGRGDEGLQLIKQGLDSGQAKGTGQSNSYFLHLLADAYLQLGQTQSGLESIGEAFLEIDRVGTRAFEPELHRVHGELLRLDGNDDDAEEPFRTAIASSEAQSARLLQLRAAAGLARLWRDQGRLSDARNLLAPIYNWFTEGFDTPDLKDAKALLDELA